MSKDHNRLLNAGREYENDASLLTLAQKIREGNPACGFIFFITDENKLDVRSDPNILPGWSHDQKLHYAESGLACLQGIRYHLGQYFDLDSHNWAKQQISKLLTFCESKLRDLVYKMRDGGLYNMRHLLSFSQTLFDLAKFLNSEEWSKKWFKQTKLNTLNRVASKLQSQLRDRGLAILNAISIQILATLGDMWDLRSGTHEVLKRFMDSEAAEQMRVNLLSRLNTSEC